MTPASGDITVNTLTDTPVNLSLAAARLLFVARTVPPLADSTGSTDQDEPTYPDLVVTITDPSRLCRTISHRLGLLGPRLGPLEPARHQHARQRAYDISRNT